MSTPITDDLEAVRVIVDAVKGFKIDEQQRIFRWAAEKLGLGAAPVVAAPGSPPPATPPGTPAAAAPGGVVDIKTFMAEKKPRNDVQYAAAAAYYYKFEAPQAERKAVISGDELQEATRKSGRDRFVDPGNTLNNAHKMGLLDKGTDKGTFVLNTVGENLVAMTLPDGSPVKKKAVKKKAAKKSSK
jgi:hypothetical protein